MKMTVEKFVKFLNAEKDRAMGISSNYDREKLIEKIDDVIKNCDDYLFFCGIDLFNEEGNDCENDILMFMNSVQKNMDYWRGHRNDRRYAQQKNVMEYIKKYNAVR